MYWDMIKVEPRRDYQLYVETKDGRCGIFDVKHYPETLWEDLLSLNVSNFTTSL